MDEDRAVQVFNEKSDEQALKEFLLDIDCLNKIDPWISKFNLFDVLKISRAEIRHSNMLGWLFDANESHGLNDLFIRGIMQRLVQTSLNSEFDVFKTLLMDFHSFVIMREWKNIDLLILSKDEKFVLCIENKVGSTEHDNQLKRYKKFIDEEYVGYTKMFVYLTPNGDEASDQDNWQTLSYADIVEVLESCVEKIELIPDINLLVENYIDVVRRDIVGDEKLMQICNEIYNKHKKALDLIIENKEDSTFQLYEVLKKWCRERASEGAINYDESKSVKTFVRFTTDAMTNILGELEKPVSFWKSTSYYYYEIENRSGRFKISLRVGSTNLNSEQLQNCFKLANLSKAGDFKDNWLVKKVMILKWCDCVDMLSDEAENLIFEALDKYLKEINEFEEKIAKSWDKA